MKTNKTILNFQVIEDYKDIKTLSILDKSFYNVDLPIENPIIEVQLPNYETKSILYYNPRQVNIINNLLLNLGDIDLLSGLWRFRFSISPNTKVFQEIVTLVIGPEINKLLMILCNDTSTETVLKITDLKSKLELAKYITEVCNEDKGLLLFNETVRDINSLIKC